MAISVQNVSHSYGENIVLKDVSIDFETGKFSAILGPNGCGKTTLFNLISRVLPLKSGQIKIAGRAIGDYDAKSLAQNLSVLPQTMRVPEFMTAHDMVMQGRYCYQSFLSRYSESDLAIVAEAMAVMQVSELAGKQVAQLSGGQLQRCRMAMLLAQEADIVLLDEPTSHLDPHHQYSLLDMGKRLSAEGKTVVAILHDLVHAELYADNVSILHNNKVYASGRPKEVITPKAILDVFTVDVQNIGSQGVGVYVPRYLV